MHFEDSLEKPRNPLKRAILRRNQKGVAFAEPTYRDAPVYDWSSEEEEEEEGEVKVIASSEALETSQDHVQNGHENTQDDIVDEITAVAPLSIRSASQNGRAKTENDLAQQEYDEDMQMLDDDAASDDLDHGKTAFTDCLTYRLLIAFSWIWSITQWDCAKH